MALENQTLKTEVIKTRVELLRSLGVPEEKIPEALIARVVLPFEHLDGVRASRRRRAMVVGLILVAVGGLILCEVGYIARRSVQRAAGRSERSEGPVGPPSQSQVPQATVLPLSLPPVGTKTANTRPRSVNVHESKPPRPLPRADRTAYESAVRHEQRASDVSGDKKNPEVGTDAKPDPLTPEEQKILNRGAPQSQEQVATQEVGEATQMLTAEVAKRQQIAQQNMERTRALGQGPPIQGGVRSQVYGGGPQQYGTLRK